MSKNEEKMHLPKVTVDDFFTTQEERNDEKLEKIQCVNTRIIDGFKDHPFKVVADEKMFETVESIKKHGVLVPAIIRPKENGRYEMVAGHRRKRACELAKISEIPCIIRNLTDDEATIIMVDSNLQRENILPSERAFAYKMKLEAMKRQGQRNDLTCDQVGYKLERKKSVEILADEVGDSKSQVQRYIRLTYLIPELLELVDNQYLNLSDKNKMALLPAVEVSYLNEINKDFTSKITDIQNNTPHDDFEINSNRAEWKDVIAIYSVLVTEGKDQSDVITLDEKRAEKLKNVFWQMNTILSRTENVEKDIETVDDKGNTVIVKMTRKVLYIDITSKSIQEMTELYHFNSKQLKQLAELQKPEYSSLWAKVLFGVSNGSSDIVQVAISQVGNVGGEPFWSWYGFETRVEWCACFVSWCAEQCGYIGNGIIPKFASCQNEGIAWFKTCGLWQEKGYTPKSRRYNLF